MEEKYDINLKVKIENKDINRNELDIVLSLRSRLNKEFSDLGIEIEEMSLVRKTK